MPCEHGEVPRRLAAVATLIAGLALPSAVLAHGAVPPDPPSLPSILFGWRFDPLVVGGLVAAALGWLLLVRRVARLHPEHPVPLARSAAFLGGLAAIAVALTAASGFDLASWVKNSLATTARIGTRGPITARTRDDHWRRATSARACASQTRPEARELETVGERR